jgi:hypothetical protein
MLRSALFAALLVGLVGCATYRDDFDRARLHYDANEYEAALLLLEVLEKDIDSLSEVERAQYAYYRGMSHYRLEQKRDARHWLGNAAARERATEGALAGEAKARVSEILGKLNVPYHGGSDDGEAATRCQSDSDCERGAYCDAGRCSGGADSSKDSGGSDEPKTKSQPKRNVETADELAAEEPAPAPKSKKKASSKKKADDMTMPASKPSKSKPAADETPAE